MEAQLETKENDFFSCCGLQMNIMCRDCNARIAVAVALN